MVIHVVALRRSLITLCSMCALSAVSHLAWNESKPTIAQENKTSVGKPPIDEFESYLSGSVLTGVFTVDGKPLEKLHEERYEIKKARRIDASSNLWEITTRIKYGDKDLEVPVEINVEWVGRTPIMVMDSAVIPGMGTFSARVVFHDKKYAGTWKHDEKGGHLFGRVEKIALPK
jgi:hypothetical protein